MTGDLQRHVPFSGALFGARRTLWTDGSPPYGAKPVTCITSDPLPARARRSQRLSSHHRRTLTTHTLMKPLTASLTGPPAAHQLFPVQPRSRQRTLHP